MSRKLFLALVPTALAMFVSSTASASTPPTFDLNIINCNCLPAGSSNGGTVTLSGTTGSVTFTVTLNPILTFHDTNAFAPFAFNYDGGATLIASGVTSGFQYSTTTPASNPEDGAGHSFNQFINFTGSSGTGGNTGVSTLSFTLTGAGITLADFEILSGNNADFAAAVTQFSTSGCTGVVSGGNGTGESTASASNGGSGGSCGSAPVPEPTSVLLFGTVLAVVGKVLKARLAVA